MNDVIMEEMEKNADNPNVQTETSTNVKNGEENMKKIF
jgi:hypothetical protein